MYTDAGPLRQLRAQARALLPPRAFLRRDRGDALFVSNAPVFAPETRDLPGFLAERRGALLYLLPEPGWVLRWERRFREPPDDLSAGLARFKGVTPDRENLTLFARAAKLLDGHPSPEEIAALDRTLRQRAAVALRGGCGGGLYATAILRSMIDRKEMLDDKEQRRPT